MRESHRVEGEGGRERQRKTERERKTERGRGRRERGRGEEGGGEGRVDRRSSFIFGARARFFFSSAALRSRAAVGLDERGLSVCKGQGARRARVERARAGKMGFDTFCAKLAACAVRDGSARGLALAGFVRDPAAVRALRMPYKAVPAPLRPKLRRNVLRALARSLGVQARDDDDDDGGGEDEVPQPAHEAADLMRQMTHVVEQIGGLTSSAGDAFIADWIAMSRRLRDDELARDAIARLNAQVGALCSRTARAGMNWALAHCVRKGLPVRPYTPASPAASLPPASSPPSGSSSSPPSSGSSP